MDPLLDRAPSGWLPDAKCAGYREIAILGLIVMPGSQTRCVSARRR